MEDSAAAVRPVRPWVSMHQGDMLSRVDLGWWMTVSKPVGSSRRRWASVMKQQICRMVSVSGFRPVICGYVRAWWVSTCLLVAFWTSGVEKKSNLAVNPHQGSCRACQRHLGKGSVEIWLPDSL